MRRITRPDLVLNKPLPWPLYDQAGNLLLQAGFVLSIPRYIDALLERGAYMDENAKPMAQASRNPAPAPLSPLPKPATTTVPAAEVQPPTTREPVFSRAESINLSIRRIHKLVRETPGRVNFADYVRSQARLLIEATEEDPDSIIAAGHLNRLPRDYRQNQQFLGAALAALLAPGLGLDGREREAVVCAALTRDVGLLHMDAVTANGFANGLSESLRRSVEEHTRASTAMLREQGVGDPLWLGFVLDHHERLHGTGYPGRKSGSAVSQGARLLGLADSYAAMVLPSERRKGMFAANAIRGLFLEKGSHYDEKHVALLYKVLTKHPPGSLVTLANGEVAVVKVRPVGDRPPPVLSVYDRNGMPRIQPTPRDTANPEHAITGGVAPEQCRSAELIIKRLWLKP
ncbi:MAG: hypothetical protein HGA47_09675 [Zoogloea sp.]|nr:hypothetical protein [Zoogloea sp.]